MLALFLSMVSCGALHEPGPARCGLDPAIVPWFDLQDLNPNSGTFQQRVTRDEHLGQVMVMYWAVAT